MVGDECSTIGKHVIRRTGIGATVDGMGARLGN
jgi:hypothetical protein